MNSDPRREASLWFDLFAELPPPLPPVCGEVSTDCVIIGGGYSGLWTAYHLRRLLPDLRIAVVEARRVGFGASGRNGGWCAASIAGLEQDFDRPQLREAAIRLQRAAFASVGDVVSICREEKIDCGLARGGVLQVATNTPQMLRMQARIEKLRRAGIGEEDLRWLDRGDARDRVRVAGALGATYSPHCAAIDPARLAMGLLDALRRRGVVVYEESPVHAFTRGRVETAGGCVRAEAIVVATEAYTVGLPGRQRDLLPIESSMIATEPLPAALWDEIGLARRETLGDGRRSVVYAQRTADDRFVFGGRGGYRFGSRIPDVIDPRDGRFDGLQSAMTELLPQLEGVAITHRWGGSLGVARDWRPAIRFDEGERIGSVGGYVGGGVGPSQLAGRTMAELVAERRSELAELPWVGRPLRRWEPEPLRWLAVEAITRLGASADRFEARSDRRPPVRGALFDWFVRK